MAAKKRPLSPLQRSLGASYAARTRWASQDPVDGTRKARAAFLAKFAAGVDPKEELTPELRQQRANDALSAHMSRLAYLSADSRRRNKAGSE
jgi:hypothetical protein